MEQYIQRTLDCLPQSKQEMQQFISDYKWQILAIGTTSYILHKLNQLRQLPPGPYGFPFLGSIHRANGLLTGELQEELKQYGDIASIKIGGELQVWLNTVDIVKEFYVNQASISSYRSIHYISILYGFKDEIFTAPYSEEWKKNKKFLTSSLKACGFGSSSYESKVLTEADALIKHLEKIQAESAGKGFTLKEPLTWTAANLINQIIFNQRYDAGDDELKKLTELTAFLIEPDDDTASGLEMFPLWISKIIYKSTIKNMVQKLEKLRAFFGKKIEDHLATKTLGEPRDFTDLYLDTRYGPEFDMDVMTDNILMLVPDAMQTVPLALEWLILNIVLHPECQKRIQQELDEVVGQGREPSLKDRPQLHYLEATILESLRIVKMFTISIPRCPQQAIKMGGFSIPSGTNIYYNHNIAHSSPLKFENPKEFKPERFLDADGKFVPSTDVIPFGIGPRSCVGQSLAKMELFLVTAKLFQTLDVKFHDDFDTNSFGSNLVGYIFRPKEYSLIIKRR